MVVTRNSQRSPQTSEVTSINKLIAKQKSEKRKIKKAKAEDKKRHNATQEQAVVFVNKITAITEVHEEPEKEDSMQNVSPSTKRQKTVEVDQGVEDALRETLSLPICSTPSSSKCRQGNEGSKDQVTATALVKRSIQSSGSKKKSNSQQHIAAVQQEDSMKLTSSSTKTVVEQECVEAPLSETVATEHDVAVATQADAKADKDDNTPNDHSKNGNADEQGNDDSISEYESVTSEAEEIEEDEEGEPGNVDEENQDEILEEVNAEEGEPANVDEEGEPANVDKEREPANVNFVLEQELEVLASEGIRGCTSETKEKKGKEAVKVSKLVSSEIFTSTSSSESSSDDQNQSESGSDDSESEEKEIEPKMKIVNQRKRKQITAVQIQSPSRLTRSRALELSLASQKAKASVRKKNLASSSVIVIPPDERKESFHLLSNAGGLMMLGDMMSAKQKEDLKEIGFDGLLHVNLLKSFHGIVPWLIQQYDTETSVFIVNDTTKFTITAFDVCDIFGLPISHSNPVIETSRQRKNNPDTYLIEQWRQKLNCQSREISSQKLFDMIVSDLRDGGADFKRFFIMYVMVTYLAPTPHKQVDWSLVKPLEDVAALGSLDWCGWVLKRLRENVRRAQKKELKYIPVCVTILELAYYHRFSMRGVWPSKQLPLVQHWTYDILKERAKSELKARCMGLGEFDSCTFPISSKKMDKNIVDLQQANVVQKDFLSIPLPEGYKIVTDEEIHNESKDDIVEELAKMKRNIDIVTQYHMNNFKILKARATEAINSSQQNKRKNSLSPTFLQWLSNPNVWKEIDDVVDKLIDVRTRASNIDFPSFDLGLQEFDNVNVGQAKKKANVGKGKKKMI